MAGKLSSPRHEEAPAMANLLFVSSSLFGDGSQSRLIASEFIDRWRRSHPRTIVVERELNADSIPHLSLAAFAAAMTPVDTRSAAERRAAALADSLIEEVEAADVIVIAAPMYNFSIPSTLKAWIDHITRAGRTFRYGAGGAEGLLKGKRLFIVTGRGGIYSGESPARAMDFQEPYLRAMLAFLGLDDVTFIHVEGLKVSPEAAASGIGRARKAIGDLLPTATAA
jgi:FMN-dependent NADH-azoreductase